ncbi:hypothetical protein VM1G_11237 [Cytospora mali]|uniref:Transcription factor domain-containing protein n=1 Tax=Cytospora mali TaxID=578113 RepID=A0A194VKF2_CYTMA|nr:hypothetical protein VM1G_11237 [Valsa mali]
MTEYPKSVSAPSGVTKKKFAVPPVKSACLACPIFLSLALTIVGLAVIECLFRPFIRRTSCEADNLWCGEAELPGHGVTAANRVPVSRECVYTPSRRGGPRSRKKQWVGQDDELQKLPDNVLAMLSQGPTDLPPQPVPVQNYIDPGAGLKHLEDWFQDSDFMFDSLFMNSNGPIGASNFNSDAYGTGAPTHVVPMVRSYQGEAAILDAYYVFIHPFFPILPPPDHIPVDQLVPRLQNQFDVFEEGFEPTSPISLAISAILSLIPCPEDINHQSHDSQVFRRKYAQYFAQSAFETIEKDEDIPDSAVEPSKPLSEDHDHNFRTPFHPCLPVELESIVALDILSVYEYAQRGNLKKMQNRAGQALMQAMEIWLQSCNLEDEFSEARRRVWWMTYTCVAQGAIVSNTKPTFAVFSPSFTAKFPTLAADPEAFPVYIKAQRAILAATQFVIELNQAVGKEDGDMTPIYERMKELEASVAPLLSRSETWTLTSTTTSPVDPTEAVVARALRCMASIKLNSARIKLHRYCAFFDIPVFSRKHCDLKSLNAPENSDEPKRWPTCSCSSFANPFSVNTSKSSSSNGNSSSGHLSPSSDGYGHPSTATPSTTTGMTTGAPQHQQIYPTTNFPFSSHQSAKICLKSALNIAHSFDELPFPNPLGIVQPPGAPCLLSATSVIACPRTMPSFACCAMQCAYALLMVHQKTRSVYPCPTDAPATIGGPVGGGNGVMGIGVGGVGGGDRPMVVNSLLVRLQQGLTSIYATLSNYATAFEALGGMRDQIRNAIEDSAAFAVPV